MIEAFFEIFFELILQLVVEYLTSSGLRAPLRKRKGPPASAWLAGAGYLVLGALLGGVSLMVFPEHWVTDSDMRLLNLVITPVAAGLLMSAIGSWRRRRGRDLLRLDQFTHGWLFAFALALVRHFGAQAA